MPQSGQEILVEMGQGALCFTLRSGATTAQYRNRSRPSGKLRRADDRGRSLGSDRSGGGEMLKALRDELAAFDRRPNARCVSACEADRGCIVPQHGERRFR